MEKMTIFSYFFQKNFIFRNPTAIPLTF